MRFSIMDTIPALDPSARTREEILEAADLNWAPELVPATAEYDGEVYDSGRRVVLRPMPPGIDNIHLGIVGSRWEPVPHPELVGYVVDLAEREGLRIARAGLLSGNRAIGFYLPFEKSFDVSGSASVGDLVNFGIFLYSPFKWGESVQVMLLAERLVCLNGMVVTETDRRVRVSHHSQTMGQLRIHMEDFAGASENFVRRAAELRDRRLSPDEALAYFVGAAGDPEMPLDKQPPSVRNAIALFSGDTATGTELAGGQTAWNAFNAMVEVLQNASVRGGSRTSPLERAISNSAKIVNRLNKLLDEPAPAVAAIL